MPYGSRSLYRHATTPARFHCRTFVTRLSVKGDKTKSHLPFSIRTLQDTSDKCQEARLQVTGYVQSLRKQSKVAFAGIRDGSNQKPLQAVLKPDAADSLTIGAAVTLTGSWRACRPGAKQSHELQVSSVQIGGESGAETYPIQNKYQSPQYLRTLPHLRSRIPSQSLLLRFRSNVVGAFTKFFASQGFQQCHTPLITSSDCEGAGEVFTVTPATPSRDDRPGDHFFRSPKYLTVSSQLHLEALAQSLGSVWTLSPTFRAERSDTSRHLSEFYMLEAELTFTSSLDDVMDVVESSIRSVLEQAILHNPTMKADLLERATSTAAQHDGEEMSHVDAAKLQARWDGLQRQYWPRITYTSAFDVLHRAVEEGKVFELAPDSGKGLQAEHERYLAESVGQVGPVFVTDYPREQKPFYMLPTPGREGDTVACFDLLMPEMGEIAGGSLREHRLEQLETAMAEKGLHPDQGKLDWYLDLRRYGTVPHGGYGLGFDRLLCYLTGVQSVRDMSAFPRWFGRCDT